MANRIYILVTFKQQFFNHEHLYSKQSERMVVRVNIITNMKHIWTCPRYRKWSKQRTYVWGLWLHLENGDTQI